jgi:nicotinamidase-related amidase
MLLFLTRELPMTTSTGRRNVALVVIDLQTGVVANAYRRDEVLSAVGMLIGRARAARVPVIYA